MKTALYRTQMKLQVCHLYFPKVEQRVILTAMLIPSWGQFGLNVARLEEGQGQQPLPGREQEGAHSCHTALT